ncbi:MAG: LOG family protein [Acidobacteria bacterium]|nr:LOG family protein [Acidobacteriota bacterium]
MTGVQIRIGVMGSAGGDLTPSVQDICRRLGAAIARRGCCLLTGACPGVPHEVVVAATRAGGHVVGISPASSLREHVDTFGSPYQEYDVLIFTGLGLMGRELVNIHSSDIVIVLSGRSGTLGEFAIAYEEGKLIGVLTGTGGITAALPVLEANMNKQTGSEVMYEADPDVLLERLLQRYLSSAYECPCYPTSPHASADEEPACSSGSLSVFRHTRSASQQITQRPRVVA